MFSMCVRMLTLLTFAGHVIVGCCTHHAHACDHYLVAIGLRSTQDHLDAAHAHTHAHHVHDHSSDHKRDDETACEHLDRAVENVPSPVSEQHEHPEDCDHSTCQFLSSRVAWDVLDLAMLVDWMLSDVSDRAGDEDGADAHATLSGFDADIAYDLGPSCALFHRWQL